MSTHSYIGIENADGTVTFAYCQFDGYPDHHGPILLGHYATEARVRELLSHGDMSMLGERCDKAAGHSYDTEVDGCTVYYGRDRGEDDTDARTKPRAEALTLMSEEYTYLFTLAGKWRWREDAGEFQALTWKSK